MTLYLQIPALKSINLECGRGPQMDKMIPLPLRKEPGYLSCAGYRAADARGQAVGGQAPEQWPGS
jgi:hypothetical protein